MARPRTGSKPTYEARLQRHYGISLLTFDLCVNIYGEEAVDACISRSGDQCCTANRHPLRIFPSSPNFAGDRAGASRSRSLFLARSTATGSEGGIPTRARDPSIARERGVRLLPRPRPFGRKPPARLAPAAIGIAMAAIEERPPANEGRSGSSCRRPAPD